jgi:hypothetical protein
MTTGAKDDALLKASLGQGDGSSEEAAGLAEQGGGKEGEATTVTLEQVMTLVNDAVVKAQREGQSYADKAVAASSKALGERFEAIDAQLKAMKDAGIELPPQAREVLRNMALEDHYAGGKEGRGEGSEGDPAGQQGQRQATPEELAARAAAQEAIQRMQKAGVIINPESPAYKVIDHETTDAKQFLASMDKAIVEHKKWLAGGNSSESEEEESASEIPGKGMQGKGEGKQSAGTIKADASPRDKFTKHYEDGKAS